MGNLKCSRSYKVLKSCTFGIIKFSLILKTGNLAIISALYKISGTQIFDVHTYVCYVHTQYLKT